MSTQIQRKSIVLANSRHQMRVKLEQLERLRSEDTPRRLIQIF